MISAIEGSPSNHRQTHWRRLAALVLLTALLGALLTAPPPLVSGPQTGHAACVPSDAEIDRLARLLDHSRQARRQVSATFADFGIAPEHRELDRNPWCAPIPSIALAGNAVNWVYGKTFVDLNTSLAFSDRGFVESTREDWCGTIARGTYSGRGFTLYLTFGARGGTRQATIDPETGFLHLDKRIFRPIQ